MLECIFLEGKDNVIQMLMAMTNLNNVFFNIAIFHLTQMAMPLCWVVDTFMCNCGRNLQSMTM